MPDARLLGAGALKAQRDGRGLAAHIFGAAAQGEQAGAEVRESEVDHGPQGFAGVALALGAGTQVFTALVWIVATGGAAPDANTSVALLAAGWVINLAFAEVAIRRSVA